MGKPDAPAPPDPRLTAAAQTGTNVGTSVANSVLGMVDQYTPYGSLTYSLRGGEDIGSAGQPAPAPAPAPAPSPQPAFTGNPDDRPFNYATAATQPPAQPAAPTQSVGGDGSSYSWTDPYTNEQYTIPRFESRIELNPEQQAALDASMRAKTNLSNLAEDRSDFLLDYLPQTEDLTDQIGNQLYDMGAQRLDPRFEREGDALRTRLANQGIAPGSEAYNREMEALGQSKNDAYNQLMLQGRGQALNEINTPINQITALLSGSQVTNPNVNMAQPSRMPTTDVAGIINNNYNQQMGVYQNEMQNRNALMGGLFGAGSTLLGAPAGSLLGGLM